MASPLTGRVAAGFFRSTKALCLLILASFVVAPQASDLDWPWLKFTDIVTNRFEKPTCIVDAPDLSGRLFVAEQTGRIWIIQNGKILPAPFLDLSQKVATRGPEQGLLGVAFPPGFQSKQYFYVYYTAPSPNPDQRDFCTIVVSRFHVSINSNMAAPRSEEVIMTLDKYQDYHNGGQLVFGPDGYLYIGVGDGGPHFDPSNRAQDLRERFGKILRIDVESGVVPYAIPPNNPFVGKTNALPEIWAYGLRNPWRFTFDRATGDLYIGDVGEIEFEEVNFRPAGSPGGENYGWRKFEGFSEPRLPYQLPATTITNPGPIIPPLFVYDHYSMGGDGGQGSVTGGYVCRGPNANRLEGMYLCADFMAGYIWGIKKVGDQWRTNALRTPLNSPKFWISTFGEDQHGRIYMADYFQGRIYEITDSGQVWMPDFSPRMGPIAIDKVRITCATEGSELHYTIDGTEPSLAHPLVPPDGWVSVPDSVTLKARAFRSDLSPSDARAAPFYYKVGAPIFSPEPYRNVSSNTLVTIRSETPGAKIYFTKNGAPPRLDDPTNTFLYTQPIAVTQLITFNAVAVVEGFGSDEWSEASYASYGIARVEPPILNPLFGPITNGTMLSITSATTNAAIYYALNPGSAPIYKLYTQPFPINGGNRVVAYADAPGQIRSEYVDRTFDRMPTATPVFDPPPQYVFANQVTISCATPGATIYYSLGGTGVSRSSPVYSTPITITNATVIQAFAVSPGNPDSSVQTGQYYPPQLYWPDFDPKEGPLTNGQSITISTYGPPGVVIRYTVDGSEPDENAPVYTGPIMFNGTSFTLKAALYAPGFISGYPKYIRQARFGSLQYENWFVSTFLGGTNSAVKLATIGYVPNICFDPAGNLYVLNFYGSEARVLKISTNLQQTGYSLAGNTSYPTSILVDAAENLYVADSGNCNRILKFTPDGVMSVLANMTSCASGLGGMQFGPDGNLYFGYLTSVWRTTPNGNPEKIAGEPVWPTSPTGALYVDRSTNVYWIHDNAVWLTKPDGATELFAGGAGSNGDGPRLQAGFSYLNGIASDGSGGLILSELNSIRHVKDDLVTTIAGGALANWGYRNGPGPMARFKANGVAVAPDGVIYVADGFNYCVRKISRDSAAVGIPDDWQQANFGTVGIDGEADADADGVSNRLEFWQGTDPKNASSRLHLLITSPTDASGALRFQWPTIAGKRYQLQFSQDLNHWTDFGAEVVGDGGLADIKDATIPDPRAKWFYRLVLLDL